MDARTGTVVEGFEAANESLSADAQSIGHAIDVVKPRGDEGDLQNALIVKADRAQTLVILLADVGRIFGQPSDIIQHHAILIRDGGGLVILAAAPSPNLHLVSLDAETLRAIQFNSDNGWQRKRR